MHKNEHVNEIIFPTAYTVIKRSSTLSQFSIQREPHQIHSIWLPIRREIIHQTVLLKQKQIP